MPDVVTPEQEAQRLIEQGWRPLPAGEALIHVSLQAPPGVFGGCGGPLRACAPIAVCDAMRDIQRKVWLAEQEIMH